MSFNNDTNHKRVAKIIEILALLDKSAESNKAPPEDIHTVMAPIFDAVEVPQAPVTKTPNERADMTIKRIAEETPLPDLSIAMQVFLIRVDEHFHSLKGEK